MDLTTYLTNSVPLSHISEPVELADFSLLSIFEFFCTIDFHGSVILISRLLRLPLSDIRCKKYNRTPGYMLSHSIHIAIDRPLDWNRAKNLLFECQKLTDLE